ncbi:hypothetical protein R5R35_011198 [Gryllus longicercus]|uniref:peptide-methionine (R)-S-oxide reductase n=1 Tax=Gryllus longicercus TaxID=2509291 RepID=A0AAN9Z8R4_9ORTH
MAFCSWKGEEYYRDHFRSGTYHCVKCNYELFSSLSKYEHDTPWPAFSTPLHEDSLSKVPEENRPLALKVSCGKCGNPLGHEFQRDREDGGSRF